MLKNNQIPPRTGWRGVAVSLPAAATSQSHTGIVSVPPPEKNALPSSSSHSSLLPSHSGIYFTYSGLGCVESAFPTRCGLLEEEALSLSTECSRPAPLLPCKV